MAPAAKQLDATILERYDRPGPRYTSYPTAPNFSSQFGEPQFRAAAAARAGSDRSQCAPLSLYVHVPFCASPCYYCGCNRVITRSATRGAEYVARLLQEIDAVAPLFPGREVTQLHLGGGTPNFLTAQELRSVLDALRRRFRFGAAGDIELSIEVDPRFIEQGDVAQLAQMGFNRVSLGVQDFDSEVQRAVNRIQTIEQTLGTIQACRAAGIESINVDLMYGLPRQTLDGFSQTLATVLGARPDRLAIYGYAHMPGLFKAQRQIRSADLPDPRVRVSLLGLAIETLTGAGYQYIGMDHFALPADELARAQRCGTLHRNFMGYSTHAGCELLGLGVSAISRIGSSFSQNHRDLKTWEEAVEQGRIPVWRGLTLQTDDHIRADVIGQIMCDGAVDVSRTEQRHAIDFWTYFAEAREKLRPLEADRLVWVCASRVVASTTGRFLLRAIAGCFDRYLGAQHAQLASGSFSKVI